MPYKTAGIKQLPERKGIEAGFTDVAVYDGSWMEWSHDNLPTVPKKS